MLNRLCNTLQYVGEVKMRRLCAWCKKDLDTKIQLSDDEYDRVTNTATHGICDECLGKEVRKSTRA